MTITGSSLRFPGCQWQWASRRDSGSTWKSLASASGISNRLGTKAERIVMTWPFLSNGCGSKGGKEKSTLEMYFTGEDRTSGSQQDESDLVVAVQAVLEVAILATHSHMNFRIF